MPKSECEPVSSGQAESARTRGSTRISGFWAAAPSEGSGRGEASGSLPEGPRKAPADLPRARGSQAGEQREPRSLCPFR